MRTPHRVLGAPGAVVAILAGCIGPVVQPSGFLSSRTASVGAMPANGIPVRGRCEIGPSEPPVESRSHIVRVDAGRCHLTHLGPVRVAIEQQINVVLGTQTAQLTLTTSDGAQVRLSAVGDTDVRAGSWHFNGAARVVGGTGRFGSITGVLLTEGTAKPGDRRAERGVVEIDGWITYPGVEPSGAAEGGER